MKNIKILFILAIALSSCGLHNYGAKFDRLKAKCELSKKDKGTPAGKCATWYPVNERVVTNTVYTEGKPVITEVPGETVYVNCDSVMQATLDEASRRHVAVKTPAVRYSIKVDTVHRYDSVYIENTARVEYQQHLLNGKDADIEKLTGQYHTWRKWAIISWLAVLLLAILFYLGLRRKL